MWYVHTMEYCSALKTEGNPAMCENIDDLRTVWSDGMFTPPTKERCRSSVHGVTETTWTQRDGSCAGPHVIYESWCKYSGLMGQDILILTRCPLKLLAHEVTKSKYFI